LLFTELPLASFFVQDQYSLKTPEYSVRIGMIFLTAGISLAMLMNIIFTNSVRQHLSSYKYFLIPNRLHKKLKLRMYELEYASQSTSANA